MEALSSGRSFRSRRFGDVSRELLRRRIASAMKENPCSICLIRIDHNRAAVLTACMHAFCIDCIRRWSNLKRRCPLCNSDFDSWYFRINLSDRTFHKEMLPPLGIARDAKFEASRRRTRVDHLAGQRVLWRSRRQLNCLNGRSRPLPRIRSFRRSESEPPYIVTQRVLEWRASIYVMQLQAISHTKKSSEQNKGGNHEINERTLRRVEPWIRRELQAILGDPDPSIIVHVASSLFLAFLEENCEVPIRQPPSMVDFLTPLRPFLHEKTNLFWHELRCFAQSPFNMESYDTVVVYKPLE